MWGKFSNSQRWCLSKSNFYLNKTVFEKCSASDSAGLISFDFSPAIYFDASHTPFSTCAVMATQFQTIVLHTRTKPFQYVNVCSCLAWSTLKVQMYSCECMKKNIRKEAYSGICSPVTTLQQLSRWTLPIYGKSEKLTPLLWRSRYLPFPAVTIKQFPPWTPTPCLTCLFTLWECLIIPITASAPIEPPVESSMWGVGICLCPIGAQARHPRA